MAKHCYGQGTLQYWLYEPADPSPASAPVVVFNHGWSAVNPEVYGAWIEHIVRRGNVVIYPVYQDSLRTPPVDFATNAIAATKAALALLRGTGHVKPELDKFAIVGHSAGGQLSATMAALAASSGLPKPRAVMCAEPGKSWGAFRIPIGNLSTIPHDTLLLAVSGDEDKIVADRDARKIIAGATRVPQTNKNLLILVSDQRGYPELVANHLAACAPDDRYDSGTNLTLSTSNLKVLREMFSEKGGQR